MKLLGLSVVLLYFHQTFAAEPKPFATCSRRWVKVGCFHDSLSPRPLPELLLNDRDAFNPANDGHMLDWNKWAESQHSLACRCAEKARAKGYKFFGLQFYGECWSGPNAEMMFSRDGPSNNCIQQLSKPFVCVKQDPFSECVGLQNTNYIYRLTENTPEPQSPDIDGGYSKWSKWTSCSSTCGYGETRRERSCTEPRPKGNGKSCDVLGPSREVQKCRNMECPSMCERAMDVAIVVDSSSSVRRENFIKVKNFLTKLVKKFAVSELMAHVGVVRYNHRAKIMWNFANRDNYNPEKLAQAIQAIKFKPGGTRTDLGMEMAGKLFRGPGARPLVAHVLMVLTDGKTSSRSKRYHEVIKHLHDTVSNLKIIPVGVGYSIDKQELTEIADGKKQNVFQMASFEELVKHLKQIVKAFCQTRLS